jgi:hypothetical protein
VAGIDGIGIQFRRTPEFNHGILAAPLFQEHGAGVVVKDRVVWVQRNGGLKLCPGLPALAGVVQG